MKDCSGNPFCCSLQKDCNEKPDRLRHAQLACGIKYLIFGYESSDGTPWLDYSEGISGTATGTYTYYVVPKTNSGTIFLGVNNGSGGNFECEIGSFSIDHVAAAFQPLYTAVFNNATDYYAFGSPMPGRNYTGSGYRYGFGSHEKMDEINGAGNYVDMGDRLLDVRLGRTPTRDKKANDYVGLSPYSYAANNPIIFIDPDGNDIILYNEQGVRVGKYTPGMEPTSSSKLVNETINALNAVHAVDKSGNGGPTPKEIVEYLATESDIILEIRPDADGANKNKFESKESEPKKGTIHYDPLGGVEILDEKGNETGKLISPTTTLAHELKHAFNKFKNPLQRLKDLIDHSDKNFKNKEEKNATLTTEKDVAKARKEGERKTYKEGDTKVYQTKSSTTTESVKKKLPKGAKPIIP